MARLGLRLHETAANPIRQSLQYSCTCARSTYLKVLKFSRSKFYSGYSEVLVLFILAKVDLTAVQAVQDHLVRIIRISDTPMMRIGCPYLVGSPNLAY